MSAPAAPAIDAAAAPELSHSLQSRHVSMMVVIVGSILVAGSWALGLTAPGGATLGNLTAHGGFAPMGWGAVLGRVTSVIFALSGAEIAIIAAAESREPARTIAPITGSVAFRILLFYFCSIALIVSVMPWTEIVPGKSPFAATLAHMRIPGAPTVMSAVVLVAVLSCLNSGLYVTSRVRFTLFDKGDAPCAGGGQPLPRARARDPDRQPARLTRARRLRALARTGVQLLGERVGGDHAADLPDGLARAAPRAGADARGAAGDPHVAARVARLTHHRRDHGGAGGDRARTPAGIRDQRRARDVRCGGGVAEAEGMMGWWKAALPALIALAAVPARAAPPADLILFNGKVVTVDRVFSVRSAVAIKDGRILAVGGPELVKRYTAARTIDLRGRMLMPGFIDTHLHLFGLSHRQIEPDKAASIAAIQAMVAAKARQLGPGEWITGYGWDEALLAEHRNLSRADLDAAAPDNPVALTRAGSHSVVANSRALALARIDANTPEPPRGVIERDAKGVPSGIIRERTDLVLGLVPPDTPAQMRPSYVASLKALLPLGITSFMEALTNIDDEPVGKGGAPDATNAGTPLAGHSWRDFKSIYAEYGADLPRITLYIVYPGAERLKAFPYHTGYGDDRIKLGPIGEAPGYDGGFTGPTAFTKEDYKGMPGFRGRAMLTPESAREMAETAARLGWQMGTHAIGDAAIEAMAAAYDEALHKYPRKDHRWFLAHFTMIPADATMGMMARDGIAAAAQPNFLYNLEGRYEQTLDGFRLQHVNPLASALSHGVHLSFGSDNLPIGPLVGFYAAVTRKGPDGKVFGADEAVSRPQAIRLYTKDAAWLAWDEGKKGSLEPGKLADMIVLDRDLLTVPEDQILSIRVMTTIVGGRIVYDRERKVASMKFRQSRFPSGRAA